MVQNDKVQFFILLFKLGLLFSLCSLSLSSKTWNVQIKKKNFDFPLHLNKMFKIKVFSVKSYVMLFSSFAAGTNQFVSCLVLKYSTTKVHQVKILFLLTYLNNLPKAHFLIMHQLLHQFQFSEIIKICIYTFIQRLSTFSVLFSVRQA